MEIGNKVVLGGGSLLPKWLGQIGEITEIDGNMITVKVGDTRLLVFPKEIQGVLNEPASVD